MGLLQIVSYPAVILFAVVIAVKTARIVRMPLHLRWDLYPIPHEKGKGAYGGSYYEEIDWWTKPKDFSLIDEMAAMAREIVFIQSLYHHNRALWVFSFPFHLGMYFLIGMILCLIVGAIMQAAGVAVSAAATGAAPVVVYHLTVILGAIGWVLGLFGGVGLLMKRLFEPELKKATVFSDYVNLLVLLAVFVSGFISFAAVDGDYGYLRGFVQGLITFRAGGALPGAVAVQLWLTVLVFMYLPFTHMTHFVGKYFTYHKVRWEDKPNIRGGKIERAIAGALGYPVTWSAPHIKSGGTWAEAATEEKENDATRRN